MIIVPAADDEPAIPGEIADAIVEAGRRMDLRNWVAASAGNISARLDGERVAITRSGVHKGKLSPEDVIAVDMDGRALTDWGRPSVETALHCQLYQAYPEIGAVVHGHSVAATVLSMGHLGASLTFAGYEALKAFGAGSSSLDLAIVDNEQDTARLAALVAPLLPSARIGYLIRGHGTYVWGLDVDTALARFEALEFLLECELARRALG